MSTALQVAKEQFLNHPDQEVYRNNFLAACMADSDPEMLFRAAAAVLEQNRVPSGKIGAFGAWLVDAIHKAAKSTGGDQGARACVSGARFAADLLELPERMQDLLEQGYDLEPTDSYAKEALEVLKISADAPLNLQWIDRAYSDTDPAKVRASLSVAGATAAQDMGELGAALVWAERAKDADKKNAELFSDVSEKVSDARAELELLEKKARETSSRRERGGMLSEVAQSLLKLEPHGSDAFKVGLDALDANSEDHLLIDALAQGYRRNGKFDEEEGLYRDLLTQTEQRTLRLHAHRKLANLYYGPLSDGERARRHLRKVLDIDPTDEEAFAAVSTALEDSGDFETLVDLYQAALRQHPPRDRSLGLLVALGRLLWASIGDLERAEEIYRRLRSLDPQNSDTLAFFENLYEQRADWSRLYTTLSQRLNHEDDDVERARIAKRMAIIASDEMQDETRALEAWKRALRYVPDDPEVQQAITQLYQKTGKWHALVDFLNAQINQTSEDQTDKKVALLFRLIEIYQDPDRIPSPDMVVKTYQRISDFSPTNVQALDSLAVEYEDRKRWRDLIQVLQKRIQITDDAIDLLDLFMQVADLWIERMANPSQAIPFLEQILALDPDNLDVVRKLREIYRAKHNVEKLYEAYERELVLENNPQLRKTILVELATLAQNRLHDPNRSIKYWEQVLQIDPESAPALSALWALYTRYEQWDQMISLVDQLLNRTDLSRKRQIELLERKGRILMTRLGQPDEARKVYGEILEIAPANTSARNALRQSYIHGREWPQLESMFAEDEDWAGYVSFLEDNLRQVEDDDLKADIYRETARIFEVYQDDFKSAGDRMLKLLEVRPGDVEAARWLLDHADQTGLLGDRPRIIEQILEHSSDASEQSQLLELGSELALERGHPKEALGYEMRRIELEATEYGTALPLDTAIELAGQTKMGEQLLACVEEAIKALAEAPDQLVYRRAAARLIADSYDTPGEAIARWRSLLEEVPDDEEALDALENLYRRSRDWEGLEDVLRSRCTQSEGSERLRILQQLATLYEDTLDNTAQALEVLREAESLAPEDLEIRMAIRRILKAEERYDELADLLETEVTRLDGRDRDRVRIELIQLRAGPLAQAHAALALIGQMLEDETDFQELLLEPLNTLMASSEVALDAARQLRRLRENFGEASELVAVLERLRELEPLPEDQQTAMLDLAEVWELRLGEPSRAFDILLELIETTGFDTTILDRLEKLARSERLRARYLALLRSLDEETYLEADQLGALRTRRARILCEDPDRRVEAAEVLESILFEDPDNTEAAETLEGVLVELDEPEALLRYYQSRVDVAFEADEKVGLYLKICGLLEDRLGRPETAIDFYRSILLLDETHIGSIESLETLLRRFERFADLADLLRRKVHLANGAVERSDIHYELGTIVIDRLGDYHTGLDDLQQAIVEHPENEQAKDKMEHMLHRDDLIDGPIIQRRILEFLLPYQQEAGNWEKVVYLHSLEADLHEDPTYRAERFADIGRVWEERLNDKGMAFQSYRRAIEIDPANSEYCTLAKNLAAETGDLERYVTTIERLLVSEAFPVPADKHLELAGLLEKELGRPHDAVTRYQKVLDHEPYHPEALRSLDRLYEDDGRTGHQLEVLERLVEVVHDPDAKTGLYWRIAKAAHRLDDDHRAMEALAHVVDNNEGISQEQLWEALSMLRQLYKTHARPKEARDILDQMAACAPNDEERIILLDEAIQAAEAAGDLVGAIDRQRERVKVEPNNSELWRRLEELVAESGDLTILSVVLADALMTLPQGPARNGYLLRRIDLLCGSLGTPSDAVEMVEAFLSEEGHSIEVLRDIDTRRDNPSLNLPLGIALAGYYEKNEHPEDEMGLWNSLLEERDPSLDAERAHQRLVTLYGSSLADPVSMVRHAAALFAITPDSDAHLEKLRGVFKDGPELLKPAIETLETEIEMAAPDVRRNCRRVLATEAQSLNQNELACALIERMIEEDPNDLDALIHLEGILREEQEWQRLTETMRHHAEIAPDAHSQHQVRVELATVLRHALGDVKGSEEVLLLILETEPEHLEAFVELRDIRTEHEDFPGLTEILERRLYVCSEEEKTALRTDLVRIQTEHTEEFDLAAEHTRDLLAAHSEDEKVRAAALELIRRASDVRETIAPQVYAALHKAEQYEEADEALSLLLEVLDDPTGRSEWLAARLDLQTHTLGRNQDAMSTILEMLEIEPGSTSNHDALLSLAEKLGLDAQLDALDRLAEILSGQELETTEATELALRLARYSRSLNNIERALSFHQKALEFSGSDEKIADELLELCRATERHDARVEALITLARDANDPVRTVTLLREAGSVLLDTLHDPDRAGEVLTELLEYDPGHPGVLSDLESLFKRQEKFDDLITHYEHWLNTAPGDDQGLSVRWRLVEALQETGEQGERIFENISSILVLDPRHQKALTLLKDMMDNPSLESDLRVQAVEILEHQSEFGAENEEKIELLRAKVRLTQDTMERADYLEALIPMLATDSPEQAFSAVIEALEADPMRTRLLESASDLANRTDQNQILTEQLMELEDQNEDLHSIPEFLRLTGDLLWDQDRKGEAAAQFESLLEIDPTHTDTHERLEMVLRDVGAHDRLCNLLSFQADECGDPEGQSALLLKLSDIQERELKDESAAIESLHRAWTLSPEKIEIFDRLESILLSQEDHDALENTYRARLAQINDDAGEAIDIRLRLAKILEQELDRPDEAGSIYEQIRSVEPAHEEVLNSLQRIYSKTERWQSLVDVLRSKLDVVAREETEGIHLQLGTVLWSRLSQVDAAIDHLRIVLNDDPCNEEALVLVEQIIEGGANVLELGDLLAQSYAAMDRAGDLQRLIKLQIEATEDPSKRIEHRERLIAELSASGDQHVEVMRQRLRCVADGADAPAHLPEVLSAARENDTVADAAQALQEAADQSTEPKTRLHLLATTAEIYEVDLKNAESAIGVFEQMRLEDPSDLSTLENLHRLHNDQGNVDALVEVLRTLESVLIDHDGDRRIGCMVERATLLHRVQQDSQEAARVLCDALSEQPENTDAVRLLEELADDDSVFAMAREVLEPLFRQNAEVDRLVRLFAAGLSSDGGPDNADLHRKSGDALVEFGSDRNKALEHYVCSLSENTYQPDLLHLVLDLSGELDALDSIREGLMEVLAEGLSPDDEVSVHDAFIRAAVSKDLLEDAEPHLLSVLELKPDRADIIDLLIAMYESAGRQQDLLDIGRRKLELPLTVPERLNTLRIVGRMMMELGQADDALGLWVEVHDLEPKDTEALSSLESIYRTQDDTVSLVDILDKRAENASSSAQYADIKSEIADLRIHRLEDPGGATTDLEDALDRDSTRFELVERLVNLYRELEMNAQLYNLLKTRANDCPTDEGIVAMWIELAQLARKEMGQDEEAIEVFEKVLTKDATQQDAIRGLIDLYDETGRHDDLVRLLTTELQNTNTPKEKSFLLGRMLGLHMSLGADRDVIEPVAQNLLKLDVHHGPSLRLLGGYHFNDGENELAFDLLKRALNVTDDEETLYDLNSKLARICVSLERLDEAEPYFQAVFDYRPDDKEAYEALVAPYEARGAFAKLEQLHSRRLELEKEPEARLWIIRRLLHIYLDEIPDAPSFESLAKEARMIRQDDAEVIALMIRFYEMSENASELVPLLSWYVNYLEARQELQQAAEQAHRLACYYIRANNWSEARIYAKMATRYKPDGIDERLTHGLVLEESKEWEVALQGYERILAGSLDEQDKTILAEVYFRMARVCIELKQTDRAQDYIQKCLALDRNHAGAKGLAQ